jgi:uncharacterized membrane protein YqiK
MVEFHHHRMQPEEAMTGLLILNLVLSIGVVVVIVGMLVSAFLADHRADIASRSHAFAPAGSDVAAHVPVAVAAVR